MNNQYEFFVVAPSGADVDAFEKSIVARLSSLGGVTLDTIGQSESLGMTGREAMLSFVISVAAGFSVLIVQQSVEHALRADGYELEEPFTVIETSTGGVINRDSSNDASH
ncbi:hypothetical protein ACFL2V_02320 [Pseudomonadota bacterium]